MNKELILVSFFVLISTLLHLRQIEFPCINSDEASFSYNAYSILKTGKDEYGSFMPTRFLAFGENKLPVTIYAIVPFIALFGMNDLTVRLPFILIGIFAPILFYILVKKLFNNSHIALIASFLASISPWIQILSRHIHEDSIMLGITIGMLLILIKLHETYSNKSIVFLAILGGIGLFTYHIGKFLAVFILWWALYLNFRNKINQKLMIKYVLILCMPIFIFLLTEIFYPSTRVGNLLFTSNQGFTLQIEQLRKEHDSRLLHNKLTNTISLLTRQYLSYFSPEFLVTHGDANLRFGKEGISPITAIEYIFVFVGIYFLFHRKEKYRYLITTLLFTAPLTAALSWQTQSITRAYLMIIPLISIAAYGLYQSIFVLKKSLQFVYFSGIILLIMYYSLFSWDSYFKHYTKNPDVITAWQCGYRELGTYIKTHYDEYNQIIVSNKYGQPYIFLLYYLAYPPKEYQKQARLTPLDEYGFGQVEAFDQIKFSFSAPTYPIKNTLYIGLPEDFNNSGVQKHHVERISFEGKEIFWIFPKSL